MNESLDRSSDDSDEAADEALEGWLSPLKSVAPPLESRVANRAAVARELSRAAAAAMARSAPWWRRSISVPVPVAAGLAALVLVSFVSASWSAWLPRPARQPPPAADQRLAPLDADDPAPGYASATPSSTPVLGERVPTPAMDYFETEVYLCGVGPLSSESGYVFREQ